MADFSTVSELNSGDDITITGFIGYEEPFVPTSFLMDEFSDGAFIREAQLKRDHTESSETEVVQIVFIGPRDCGVEYGTEVRVEGIISQANGETYIVADTVTVRDNDMESTVVDVPREEMREFLKKFTTVDS